MLDYNFDRPEEKTFIVNEMQSIFDRLFDQASMGPMFQQYMRNALLLLMEDAKNEPATLVEVPRILPTPSSGSGSSRVSRIRSLLISGEGGREGWCERLWRT